MTHWAAPLIGKPWSEGGEGPDSFSCWGLVRHVFREQHGIDMPMVAIGETENVGAIKRAAEASGWRRADSDAPQPDDIVLMTGANGRHVGVVIDVGGHLRLLHADGAASAGVVAEPWSAIDGRRYWGTELWRKA